MTTPSQPGAAKAAPVISDTMKKPLSRRFYTAAAASDEAPFSILLDGRPVKTPGKRHLHLPSRALAEAVAAEWAAQGPSIDPATMPLTRIANTALDGVSENMDAVAADIAEYAGNDLICYRAEAPAELSALQARHWDPVLTWARAGLGAHLCVVTGIMPVAQCGNAIDRFRAALLPHEPFWLTGLHVVTTLTGSAFLALALARGVVTPHEVWAAAHVDEDYQISLWGEDYEAANRRRLRRLEFDAACRFLTNSQAD